MEKVIWLYCVISFIVIGLSSTVQARVFRVPKDCPTIQAAIDKAEEGDEVKVDTGTYLENINFKGKEIIVWSEKGANVTIIDGGKSGSVVTFNSGETRNSTLDGFTIQNGKNKNGGGILIDNDSNPTIMNCVISGNEATSSGGGYHCNGSNPSFINCEIRNNTANESGGEIYSGNCIISTTR